MVSVKVALMRSCISRGISQLADELDLAFDTWLFVLKVAAFDCSDRLNTAQGRFR